MSCSSSLSTFQYNLCHSTGLPQEPLCCPPIAQMAVLFITSSISYSLQIQHSSLLSDQNGGLLTGLADSGT